LNFRRVPPHCSLLQNKFASALQRIAVLAFCCEVLIVVLGCGSGATSQVTHDPIQINPPHIEVVVSPNVATIVPAANQQFTASVKGTSNTAVTWKSSAGSISTTGLFAAPTAADGTQITITATSIADPAQHATSVVTIQSSGKLSITTPSLSDATINLPYAATLAASGGNPPYRWSILAGSLPSGILLQPTGGELAGTTVQPGQYSFIAKVSDASSNSATQSFTLTVSQTSGCGSFDGPAQLPCVYLNTTLADTPAPGATIAVSATGDFQGALNSASCGDTITLQAGATYSAGQYVLPAKSCDDQHWIIIRTSAADSSLPPEGTRITPCYVGVTSLPGRPVFPCNSPAKVLATISYPGTGQGPIILANGANHYRLLGLEITRTANNGKAVDALIVHEKDGATSQIVYDRLYVHGTPKDETRRGVDTAGGTSIAVQDSYISDLHCNVLCTDSQAVSGGTGDLPMGPLKIDDNFLESAGENILFGGGPATQTPADIEIRFNHLFKPMFWMQGQPGFTAPAPLVKNHFELKNAQRVLFDSNILEDDWGGFTQHGFSIILTAKNQGEADGDHVCPICEVTDITVRYVTISHVGGAIIIGNNLSGDAAPHAGKRFSVHDVIADDISEAKYNGHGVFMQIGTIANPLLQDVQVTHITAFPDHTVLNVGGPNTVKIPGFVFSNSIVAAGEYPVTSTGRGGDENCAYYQVPITAIGSCFAQPVFAFNGILASPLPQARWPRGNFFYSVAQIGFVNYSNGNGGNYNLLPSSPAIGAASDGTNLGANVDAVMVAVSNVR
jgi:hypothetical protein